MYCHRAVDFRHRTQRFFRRHSAICAASPLLRGPMLSTNQGSPLLRVVVIGAGIVIIAAGMKATATVVNLVLLSVLLAATLSPVPVLLSKWGIGRGAAIGLTALLTLVGGIVLIVLLARSMSRLSVNLPTYQASLAGLVDGV